KVYYGKLNKIIVLTLPNDEFWNKHRNVTKLLAFITPCQTRGKDATKDVVEYTETTAQIVTDLQAVMATVGRVRNRRGYGIIDRSNESVNTTFIE
ncbi:hypothetical protein BDP27DRAFT_1232593, partial [Rhodocollybia butyracea]